MNNMNKKKYKLVKNLEAEEEYEEKIDIPKLIVQYGILSIICILSFLVAKFIVTNNIEGEKPPIDTSERL